MSGTTQRITRTSQPQTPVGIDWSNPVTKGLLWSTDWVGGSLYCAAKGKSLPLATLTSVATPGGIASVQPINLDVGGNPSPTIVNALVKTSTIFIKNGSITHPNTIIVSGDSYSALNAGNTSTVLYWRNTAGERKLGAWLSWGSVTLEVSNVPDGLHTLSLCMGVNAVPLLYLDGVLVSSGAATTNWYYVAYCAAGGYNSQTLSSIGVGNVLATRLLTGTYNPAQAQSLSANPWQIFSPIAQPIFIGASVASDGPPTATLAVTEGADTLSSSGTVSGGSVTGTLATTDGADTLTSAATVAATSTLATTDGADSISSAATVALAATLATTDGADTLSASGVIGSVVVGTLATTDAGDTLATTGAVLAAAALAATDAADTLSSAASAAIAGTLAATESGDTLTCAVTIGNSVSASLSATDAADTLASVASLPVASALAATEGADTLASVASLPVSSALAATDAADTLGAAVAVLTAGTSTTTDGADTISASGVVGTVILGTLSTTDAADAVSAAGVVLPAATLAVTEAGDTCAATGIVGISATGAAVEQGDSVAAQVSAFIRAQLAAVDSGDTLFGAADNGSYHPRDPLRTAYIAAEYRGIPVAAEGRLVLISQEIRSTA